MSPGRSRLFTFAVVVFGAVAFVLTACSETEVPVPIDLGQSTTTDAPSPTSTAAPDGAGGSAPTTIDDPNAEARQQVIDAAEQQCLDDPEQEEGVVQIVDATTDEVVNEYRVDCDEVRDALADDGS